MRRPGRGEPPQASWPGRPPERPAPPAPQPRPGRLVFGIQPVREAVRAHGDRVERILVERGAGPKLDALARFAEGKGIPVEVVPRAELDRRAAGGRHQGALALAPDLALVPVGELRVGPSTVVVALDGVMDPQ